MNFEFEGSKEEFYSMLDEQGIPHDEVIEVLCPLKEQEDCEWLAMLGPKSMIHDPIRVVEPAQLQHIIEWHEDHAEDMRQQAMRAVAEVWEKLLTTGKQHGIMPCDFVACAWFIVVEVPDSEEGHEALQVLKDEHFMEHMKGNF